MSLMTVRGTCRGCSREIAAAVPSKPKAVDAEYVRCDDCGTVTRLTVASEDSGGAWRVD